MTLRMFITLAIPCINLHHERHGMNYSIFFMLKLAFHFCINILDSVDYLKHE